MCVLIIKKIQTMLQYFVNTIMNAEKENVSEENSSPVRNAEESSSSNTVIRRITTAGTIEENEEARVEDVVQEEIVKTSSPQENNSGPSPPQQADDTHESQQAVEYLERSEEPVYTTAQQHYTNDGTITTTEAYPPQIEYGPFEIIATGEPVQQHIEAVESSPQEFASLQPANYDGAYTDGNQLIHHHYNQFVENNMPLLNNRSDPTLASSTRCYHVNITTIINN